MGPLAHGTEALHERAHCRGMTTTPSPTANGLDRCFAALYRSPVTRSRDQGTAGDTSGLAERLGVSAGNVRIVVVMLESSARPSRPYLLTCGCPITRQDHMERAIRNGEGSSVVLLVARAVGVARRRGSP